MNNLFGMTVAEIGLIMRSLRRASNLALQDAKEKQLCQNTMNASLLIYTDCPCAAAWASRNKDLVHICGVSQIEGVLCVMGPEFPPAAFLAEKLDPDMPQIAAMFFHARGKKCPRCRAFSTETNERDLCPRCSQLAASWKRKQPC